MNDESRITESGQMVLKTLKLLNGHALSGISNTEIAKALNKSPANVNRYLNTLIAEGLATKLDNGRFAQSIGLLQIAQGFHEEMTRMQHRIQETTQRVLAGSR